MCTMLTDAHVGLLRAIRQAIAADQALAGWLTRPPDFTDGVEPVAQRGLIIENSQSEPWASLTFSEMRHRLDVRLCGEEAQVSDAYERLKVLLDDPDLAINNHFLAEFTMVDSLGKMSPDGWLDLRIRIEALTIEA